MRLLFVTLGFAFVVLATAGAFLPILPTTPFLLVAAACFAKSSPHWHQWLLSNRIFGALLQRWHQYHCVSLSSKIIAITSIVLFGGYSLYAVDTLFWQALLLILLLTGLIVVLRLKVCDKNLK